MGCLLGVLVLSHRLLPDDRPKRPALMALTFLILGKYFVREVFLGQSNLVITVLLLLMVWHLRASAERGSPAREAAAGALWGVATTLKPYGLVFLPYLVITRRWGALLAGLGVAGLAAVAPVPFYGVRGTVDEHVGWATTLADSSPQLLTNVDNTSLVGFFAKWTGNAEITAVLVGMITVLLAIFIAGIVFLGRQQPRAVALDGALLLTLIPLLAPLGWDYMLLMSAPGVMLLLHQRARFTPVWREVLVANLVVIAVTVTEVVGHTLHELYEGWVLTTVNSLVVVAFLAALRFKRVC